LLCQVSQSHEKGALLQPSFVGSKRKTSDENRGNPKTQGAQKKHL
jgi:hypothetical protein